MNQIRKYALIIAILGGVARPNPSTALVNNKTIEELQLSPINDSLMLGRKSDIDPQLYKVKLLPEKGIFNDAVLYRQDEIELSYEKIGGRKVAASGMVSQLKTFAAQQNIPVYRFGATFLATDSLGIRVTANYRNTNAYKIAPFQSNAMHYDLRQKVGVGLGVLYSIDLNY